MHEPMSFWDAVEHIRRDDDRYATEAYGFLMDALEHTLHSMGEHRHITADELLDGVCRFSHARYGVMSYTLLECWGVTSTSDIGELVFQLVGAGVLSRTEDDAREHFDDVFDLRDVLEGGYFEQASGGAEAGP